MPRCASRKTAAPRGDGVGVQNRVGVETGVRRVQDAALVVVEKFLDFVGSRLAGGAVDDLVGDAHDRVQVADIAPFARGQQSAGQAETGGVCADDFACGGVTHRVVPPQPARCPRCHGIQH